MKKFFSIFFSLIFLSAFCFSAYKMYSIIDGYNEGEKEIAEVYEAAVITTNDGLDDLPGVTASITDANYPFDMTIDFEELKSKNRQTIGWIRFAPEPNTINYPIVQTSDNETYLNRTFSGRENTLGAIFMDCVNSPDFSDDNTIIYGHRMKNKTMFYHLQDYKQKEFWAQNPYFYIYTPDGMVSTYQIFACSTIPAGSDTYDAHFGEEQSFNRYIKNIKNAGYYDTGIEVPYGSKIITLSTCTAASDDNRITVRGVLVETNPVY